MPQLESLSYLVVMVDRHLLDFYAEGTFERDRLTLGRGRLEFARMQELLRRVLPPAPAHLLDVGGGAGAHAAWLAHDGYHVQLIDPVPELVEQANARAATQPGHLFNTRVGDARSLDESDQSVDAVLLLGPLYHLPEREDRLTALHEAARVLRPGGVVAAAAISRYCALLDLARRGDLDTDVLRGMNEGALATGRHDPSDGFTTAFFHRPDELIEELVEAGFVDVHVVGVEGPGWMFFEAGSREGTPDTPAGDETILQGALLAARAVEDVPELLGASAHLLAIGHI